MGMALSEPKDDDPSAPSVEEGSRSLEIDDGVGWSNDSRSALSSCSSLIFAADSFFAVASSSRIREFLELICDLRWSIVTLQMRTVASFRRHRLTASTRARFEDSHYRKKLAEEIMNAIAWNEK